MIKILQSALFIYSIAFTIAVQAQSGTSNMTENEVIVREFIAAWANLDPVQLASYFTEDGVYHNMPSNPIRGRANIQAFIAGFIRPWQETDWDIISLVAAGNTVIAERADRTKVSDQLVVLPVVGVFIMADGKIKEWRDYFDLNSYMEQLNAALERANN